MLQVNTIVLIFYCLHLSSATCDNLPILLPGKELVTPLSDSNQPTCPSEERRELTLQQLNRELDSIIEAQLPILQSISLPPECPGQGWIKIVDFNLENNPDESCPGSWSKPGPDSEGRLPAVAHCRHSEPDDAEQCESANFSTNNTAYTQICGRVRGYQVGRTFGFFPYNSVSVSERPTINGAFLNGVVITHGMPRTHIWSFVSGDSSSVFGCEGCVCPCINAETANSVGVPSFLNGNYFCDSGTTNRSTLNVLYDNNPLWDGKGCESGNGCCAGSRFFVANLTEPTCDDLEVRICIAHEKYTEVNVGIDLIEIYVK